MKRLSVFLSHSLSRLTNATPEGTTETESMGPPGMVATGGCFDKGGGGLQKYTQDRQVPRDSDAFRAVGLQRGRE